MKQGPELLVKPGYYRSCGGDSSWFSQWAIQQRYPPVQNFADHQVGDLIAQRADLTRPGLLPLQRFGPLDLLSQFLGFFQKILELSNHRVRAHEDTAEFPLVVDTGKGRTECRQEGRQRRQHRGYRTRNNG